METIGIRIELENADEAYATIKRIESTVHDLGRKKTMIQLDDGNLDTIDNRIKEIRDRLVSLKAAKDADVITDEEVAEAKRLNAELKILERSLKNGTQGARSFKQEFQSIQSTIAHIGSGMQSLGNALTRLSSPFTRLTTGLVMGAGYKALNLLTSGFSGAFERADTMKNYPRMLKEFGFSAEEATVAVSELEQAVLGLPTGLDEIVAVQKRFLAASQDMDKATGLAIAFNNAILASGSDARQQLTAQRIITQLAGGAEIATTSWQALQRAIPLVFTQLAKDANMGVGDYVKALSNGEIATEDFMKAFIKIGGEGSIASAARVMTKSWEGLTANITNSTKRMGTAILDTLHEVFKSETGRDLLDTLLGIDAEGNRTYDGIRDWIDKLSKSIQNWIKSNPDKILDFFETLKNIDWKGLLKGMAEGIGDLIKVVQWITELLGDKDLSKFGKRMVMFGAIGRGLTILGGIIKGLRGPLAFLFTGASRFKGKGLFGKIAGLFGKKRDITTAGETAKTIPTVADSFRGAFKALQGVITAAGAVVLVTGTGAFAFKAIKSMIRDLKDIGEELKGFEAIDGYAATGIIAGIGVFTEIFNGIGKLLGPEGLLNVAIAGVASFIVAGSFAADLWAIKTGLQQLKDTVLGFDEVASAIENLKGFTNFATAKQKVSQMVDAISEIVSLFHGESANHKEGTERTDGLKRLGKGKVNTITNLTNALDGIKKAVDKLNQLASVGIASNARSKAHLVMSAIKDVMDEFSSLTWMTSPTNNLKKNATNLAGALKQINTLANRINTLAGLSVNTDGFASFVQQVKTALNELKSIEGDLELDVEVKLASGFQKSVNNVIKLINDARNKIAQQANNAVNVTIPINVKFRVKTNVGTAINAIHSGASAVRNAVPTYPAKGGLIYRAKGGDVSWKRKGTDTVPAMLTPGEYVHNKRAVNMFGIDFMRKVNSLDMKGAMNELMHRAGGMANINRGTTINNNTYNNQRATINVTTNSAEFTGRLASRFVGAF